jgi:hypothetical protein
MTIVLPAVRGAQLLRTVVESIARSLDGTNGLASQNSVDVVVVAVDEAAASQALEPFIGKLRVTVLQSDSDLGAMRNAGIAAATGDITWLIDDRVVVTRAAVETHFAHGRQTAKVLTGPSKVRTGHPEFVDAAWWYLDRDVRLAEHGFLTDARDAVFTNASAPTALLRAFPFTTGYHGLGIEDVELGMVLSEAGYVTAFQRSAGVGSATVTLDEVSLRIDEGEDRALFLGRHPLRADMILRTTPGRLERLLRRFVSSRCSPQASRVLSAGARLLCRLESWPVIESARLPLVQFGELFATYGGIARVAASNSSVREALGESSASATVPPSRIGRWARHHLADPLRMWLLPMRVHHVHGARRICRSAGDLLAITVVRDGRYYVEAFLDHHRRLGIRHFVMLDNGSTDGTLDVLCAQPDVTVLRTSAPYKHYENLMKRYLVRRFSRGRWNVFLDIDELFEYPESDRIDLAQFLGYLDHRRYTAVVAQMLDLFPREPLAAGPVDPPGELGERFPFFDISNVSKLPYHYDTQPESPLRMHRGGIRRTVFGTDNALTKAPLIRCDDRIEPFVDWHHARQATFADVSCVLLHYPFAPKFAAKAEEAARTGRYGIGASHEYRAYWALVRQQPELCLYSETAERFENVQQLVDTGFVLASECYLRWVDEHSATNAAAVGDR